MAHLRGGVGFVGFVGTLLLAGCIPGRDNPFDPTNAPAVTLRVVDLTETFSPRTRTCAPVTDPREFPAVAAVSRGRCLALEADGDELTERAYFLVGSNGEAFAEPIALGTSQGGRLELDSTWLRKRSVGVALDFELRAEDRDGNHARVRASLVLLNAPPVAVADPSRIWPPGGPSWAPAELKRVAFDGDRSFDPDGDPLRFCWHIRHESATVCRTADQAPIERDVPTRGRIRAELTVDDGIVESEVAVSAITFRDAAPWVVAYGGYGTLDPFRALVDLDDPFSQGGFSLGRESGRLAEVDYSTESLRVRSWPEGAILDEVLLPELLGLLAVDERRIRVHTLRPSTRELGLWSFAGDTIAAVNMPQPATLAPGVLLYSAVVDSAGSLWISAGDAVHLFDAAGTERVLPTGDVRSIAVRPAADGLAGPEVWGVDELTGDVVRVVDGLSVETLATLAPGRGWIRWISDRDFWLAHEQLGIVRLDARRLAASGDLAAAEIVAFPELAGLTDAPQPDPWDSTLWLGAGHATYHVYLDGTVDLVEGYQASPPSFDPDGVMRFTATLDYGGATALAARRGLSPATGLSSVVAVPFFSPTSPTARDEASASLWVATVRPSLARLWPGGDVEEWISMVEDGTEKPFPSLARLFVSADASHAWGVTELTGELYRFDLAGPIPVGERVLDFEASERVLPVFPSGDAALVYGFATPAIRRVAPGSATTDFFLPLEDVPATRVAPVPAGGYCAVFVYDTGGGPRDATRYLDDDGSSLLLADETSSFTEYLVGLQGARDEVGAPVCWASRKNGVGTPLGLRAYDPAGLRHADPGNIESFRVMDGDTYWMTDQDLATASLRPVRITLDPSDVRTEGEPVTDFVDALVP